MTSFKMCERKNCQSLKNHHGPFKAYNNQKNEERGQYGPKSFFLKESLVETYPNEAFSKLIHATPCPIHHPNDIDIDFSLLIGVINTLSDIQ